MERSLSRVDRILGGGEQDLASTISNLRAITDNLRDLAEEPSATRQPVLRRAPEAAAARPAMNRSLAFALALAATATALGACSLTRPSPVKEMYLIEPPPATAVSPTSPFTARIGTVTVAAPYRYCTFVVREADLRFQSDFYREYVVAPAPMIAEAVARSLGEARVFSKVIPPARRPKPSSPSTPSSARCTRTTATPRCPRPSWRSRSQRLAHGSRRGPVVGEGVSTPGDAVRCRAPRPTSPPRAHRSARSSPSSRATSRRNVRCADRPTSQASRPTRSCASAPVTATRTTCPGASDAAVLDAHDAVDLGRVGRRCAPSPSSASTGATPGRLDRVDDRVERASDLRRESLRADRRLLVHEARAASLAHVGVDRPGQRIRRSAFHRRIGEAADAVELGFVQERQELVELGVGLARKSCDERVGNLN